MIILRETHETLGKVFFFFSDEKSEKIKLILLLMYPICAFFLFILFFFGKEKKDFLENEISSKLFPISLEFIRNLRSAGNLIEY